MCSENLFMNCYFSRGGTIPYTGSGLYIRNYNALGNTVIGGNIAQCGYGIYVHAGSAPTIYGVGFQNYTIWGGQPLCYPGIDIYIENSAGDAYAISGCRSESDNFLKIGQPITTVSVNGCTLLGSNPGFFFFGSGNIIINGWQARAGKITAQNASVILNGCSFPADYLKDPVKGSTFNYSDQPNAGYRNHGCAIHHQRV
jgi:hypothetical protein